MNDSDVQFVDESRNLLEGWSKEDKFYLMQGLKQYGSDDISSIKALFPEKTTKEISSAIHFYKTRALKRYKSKSYDSISKRNKVITVKSSAPLANWANVLMEKYNTEALQTELSTALRLIADCDSIPPPVATNNIDFRKAYHLIADAMEGKTITIGKDFEMLLNNCLHSTVMASRQFIKKPILNYVLTNLDLSAGNVREFPKKGENAEVTAISELATYYNYNPLNIPGEYLKPYNYVPK